MSRAVFYHPPIAGAPLVTSPLAYLYLATALKLTEHRLELLDGRVLKNPIAKLLERLDGAEAMLVSAMPGSQVSLALAACAAARAAHPELPIYWGGSLASVDPERTLACPLVSGVVVGRGELGIADLLAARGDPAALEAVPNLSFKDRAGRVRHGPRAPLNGAAPRPPDYGLLQDIEPYICQTRRSRRMIDYVSSFGCPHRCAFCSEPITSGSRWAAMGADETLEAILELHARYAVDGVLFQDARFVSDPDRLIRFCRGLVAAGAPLRWISTACTTDVLRLEEEGALGLLRDSGCEQLFIGAEAASPETLREYRKAVTSEGTYRVAQLLWGRYGILPHFSYVIGHPVESLEQVEKTLHLHRRICELVGAPTGELGIYNPVPNTAFLEAHRQHYRVPHDLAGWAAFDYSGQALHANPSPELSKLLFRHHVTLRRMFPKVPPYVTFDVWQDRNLRPRCGLDETRLSAPGSSAGVT